MVINFLAFVLLINLLDVPVEAGWREEGLDTHNRYRKAHGAAALKLDAELNQEAQAYADKMARLNLWEHDRSLPSKNGRRDGENLWMRYGGRPTELSAVKQAVKGWYDEKKDWNYSSATCKKGRMCGHFTQVVWKETRKLGLGYGQKNGRAYIVARYSPGGNFHYVGQKRKWYNKNVQKEGGDGNNDNGGSDDDNNSGGSCKNSSRWSRWCGYWAKTGLCAWNGTYEAFMRGNCKKSCGFC